MSPSPHHRTARLSAPRAPKAARSFVLAAGAAAALSAVAAPAAQALSPIPPPGVVRSGSFVSLDHSTSGRATVVRLASGARQLRFSSFRLAPGPNVHVYLVAGSPRGTDDYTSRIDLGRLKSASGYQTYTIPASVNLARHRTVLLWCVPFRVGLGRADLRLPG